MAGRLPAAALLLVAIVFGANEAIEVHPAPTRTRAAAAAAAAASADDTRQPGLLSVEGCDRTSNSTQGGEKRRRASDDVAPAAAAAGFLRGGGGASIRGWGSVATSAAGSAWAAAVGSVEKQLVDDSPTLRCASTADVVILLDGSGALGKYGWTQAKSMLVSVLGAMVPGSGMVVAFLIYSGPTDFQKFQACTSDNVTSTLDAETDCGLKWVSRFTMEYSNISEEVQQFEFPRGPSLTYKALTRARGEFLYGRAWAPSIVLLVSGAKPVFESKTTTAAQRLTTVAKFVWVAVGNVARDNSQVTKMREWVSAPSESNLILAEQESQLTTPCFVNTVIAAACR